MITSNINIDSWSRSLIKIINTQLAFRYYFLLYEERTFLNLKRIRVREMKFHRIFHASVNDFEEKSTFRCLTASEEVLRYLRSKTIVLVRCNKSALNFKGIILRTKPVNVRTCGGVLIEQGTIRFVLLPLPHSEINPNPKTFETVRESAASIYQALNVIWECNHMKPTQIHLNIMIHRLKLSQWQPISLARNLKQVNILPRDIPIYIHWTIGRHKNFKNLFKSLESNSFAFCPDISPAWF